LTPERLDLLFPGGLQGYHVGVCGPEALVADVTDAAYQRGAATVQSEDFDMRQGFGPDRSREWNRLFGRLRRRSTEGRSSKGLATGSTPMSDEPVTTGR
jgi:hypothetical protein